MTKYYSKSTGGFYDKDIHGDNIPSDAFEISDNDWESLLEGQSSGKVIGAAANGTPELQDPPALTQQQQIDAANVTKSNLMRSATNVIAPLQDAVDLDQATDDEKSKLTAWKKYRVLLNRVDTSTAPSIEWPSEPE